jgi:hypothetical protein
MTAEMAVMPREMRSLTRWIAGLTVVNTVGVLVTLWRTWE